MSRVVASELLKLRTTRTSYALVGSSLALVLLIAGLGAALGEWGDASSLRDVSETPGRDLIGIVGLVQLFALVLGIIAVGTEFRHGTITPTLLAVPDRLRLLNAKLIVHLVAGVLLGLVAFAATLALIEAIFSSRGIDSGLSGSEVLKLAGGAGVAVALYAALGIGLGALIRNQVGAIVGALAYVFVVESLLQIIPGVDEPLSKYGLNGVTEAVTGSSFDSGAERLSQLPAGLLLAAYVAVFVVAGALALRGRDITA